MTSGGSDYDGRYSGNIMNSIVFQWIQSDLSLENKLRYCYQCQLTFHIIMIQSNEIFHHIQHCAVPHDATQNRNKWRTNEYECTVSTPIRIFLISPVSISPEPYFLPISANSSSSSKKKLSLLKKSMYVYVSVLDCYAIHVRFQHHWEEGEDMCVE